MSAPAAPPVDDATTEAVLTAVSVLILTGATVAEVKAALLGLAGMTALILDKIFTSRKLAAYVAQAVTTAAAGLPPTTDVTKPSTPVDKKGTKAPAPVPPAAKTSTGAGTQQPKAAKANPWAGNDIMPQSVRDQVDAAMKRKGKARPRPARPPAASVLVKQKAAVREAIARGSYLTNAAHRLQPAYDSGDDAAIAAAETAEDRYAAQHEQAIKERARAVRLVAKAVAGKSSAAGEILLGWYAHISPATCARCLRADGKNFNALEPPPIGYPGTVHPHDHCLPGAPHETEDRVEDVDPGARVSRLQFGKGSKLWKYWTGAKGFARYAGAVHPWTALRNALLSEDVPAGEADGLATNIMMATPAGRALFAKGHSKKRSSEMKTETRTAQVVEVRSPDAENPDVKPGFTARAVVYEVPDTYRTSWQQGVFAEALETRLPSVVWNHDWADPVGRVVAYRDSAGGLDIDVEFDDFDAVPRAKQAHAQMRSGTMDQFSFAFIRDEEVQDPKHRGVMRQVKAGLQEFSIVLNGSVPGTHSTSVRSAQTISADQALDITRRFAAGELTLDQAQAEVRSVNGQPPVAAYEFRALTADGAGETVDPGAVLEAVDAAMASVADQLDKANVEAARRYFQAAASRLSELQYLLGMVPGLSPDSYAWRAQEPGDQRGEPDKLDTGDADEIVLARLDTLRSVPTYHTDHWMRGRGGRR